MENSNYRLCFASVCVCVCMYVCMCVYVSHTYTYTHSHIHIHTYIQCTHIKTQKVKSILIQYSCGDCYNNFSKLHNLVITCQLIPSC